MCLPPKPRNLPEDPAALKELLRAARAERDRAEQRAAEQRNAAQARPESRARGAADPACRRALSRKSASAIAVGALPEVVLRAARRPAENPRGAGASAARLRRGMGAETRSSRRSRRGERAGRGIAAGEAAPGKTRPGELREPPGHHARLRVEPGRARLPGLRRGTKRDRRGGELADRIRARPLRAHAACAQEVRLCALRSGGRNAADAGGGAGRLRRSSGVWRGRGCWPTSWRASLPIICRSTGWKIFSRARDSRFRAPRSRSGAGTWPTWSSPCTGAWPSACGPPTWWPPTTPCCPCSARARPSRRGCGSTWATPRIPTTSSTSPCAAAATDRKSF